ncbi:transcriptional repressor sin3p, partial [Nannochloropsis gaditana CCMP526]|uniref:transcriptional repressor sin3p n=1 Tax=Nannochloropsis gaditana (strain CCMP526) TaxID=1093141 RepID=UPI00029F6EF2
MDRQNKATGGSGLFSGNMSSGPGASGTNSPRPYQQQQQPPPPLHSRPRDMPVGAPPVYQRPSLTGAGLFTSAGGGMASLFANPNSSLPAASSNFQGLYSGSNAHLMNNNASKPGQDWHRGLPPPSYSLPYNAPSPAFPGRPSMPPSHAALMQNALVYLELVQRTFAHQPDIYASFLSVMREHKEGRRDTPNLCGQVSRLFQGQDSLLRGFQDFLSGIHAVDPPLPSPAPSVPGPASFPHSMGHPSGYRGWNARPSAPPSHPPFLPGGNGTRPPLQTGVTEGGGEAKEDVSMEDAVLYMDRVKSAYADKPEVGPSLPPALLSCLPPSLPPSSPASLPPFRPPLLPPSVLPPVLPLCLSSQPDICP